MPYEEITEELYNTKIGSLKPFNINELSEESVGEKFCDGEACQR
jgi:hypothetical protein